jgi:type I restriction enzyme, S subunit
MSSEADTTTAKNGGARTLTPKLRFPEFRAAPGWEHRRLAPFLEDCSGRVPSDTELPIYSSTREGLTRQDAYFDGRVLLNKNEYGVVPPGCFVYRHMSDDGTFKFNINDTGGDIAVSKEYPVFRTRGLNSRFLLEKLNDGPDFKQFALSQEAGGTRTRLYFGRLREWETFLPSPSEQQKIADCLSSVDELISAQVRKVDALKTHKEGLMKQLFPREGETQPRLRFPEFRDAGDWEVKTGEAITTKITKGSSPSWQGYNYQRDGVLFITSENVRDGFLDISSPKFLPRDFYLKQQNSHLRCGDILINIVGASIGRSCLYREKCDAFTNQAVALFRANKHHSAEFLSYCFQNDQLQTSILESRSDSARPNLSLADLKDMEFIVPILAEQQRIAACFNYLDKLVTAQTQKLDALKTHKKGLMQQLFPSMGEADA